MTAPQAPAPAVPPAVGAGTTPAPAAQGEGAAGAGNLRDEIAAALIQQRYDYRDETPPDPPLVMVRKQPGAAICDIALRDTDAILAIVERVRAEARREALAEAQARSDVPSPCDMKHRPPMDFAFCETHDTTFPLGGVCKWHGASSVAEVLQAEVDEQRRLKVRAEMAVLRLRDALTAEPTDAEVEAGARAFLTWDVEEHPEPVPTWDSLHEVQRNTWREGARVVLTAAREARQVKP